MATREEIEKLILAIDLLRGRGKVEQAVAMERKAVALLGPSWRRAGRPFAPHEAPAARQERHEWSPAPGWVFTWEARRPNSLLIDDEAGETYSGEATLGKGGDVIYSMSKKLSPHIKAFVPPFFVEMHRTYMAR